MLFTRILFLALVCCCLALATAQAQPGPGPGGGGGGPGDPPRSTPGLAPAMLAGLSTAGYFGFRIIQRRNKR